MRSFLVALNFLTILPVPVRDVDGRDLGRSMALFPLIGLLIGSLLALIFWAGSRIFPSLTMVAFILATEVVISGAMHLDGFMDTVDGLMSGGDQKEILKVMKMGNVGAYAVIAAICLFLLKFSLIFSLSASFILPTFILMPALGRWAMVFMAFFCPYPREGGIGKPFKDYLGSTQFAVATLILVGAALLLLRLRGLFLFLVIAVILSGLAVYFTRKIGGATGDIMGGTGEVVELIAVLVMAFLR